MAAMTRQAAPRGGRDEAFMARALALAERARGRTAPNPMVGAVVVANGRVVGEGFHARAGLSHAEPLALAQAGARARGATLYVTLEPCHHTGRTGPCTAAIVAAGIARVVVAGDDNDARVMGRGLAFLQAQGIAVRQGVLRAQAARLNAAYHHAKACGRPWVVAKWAQSLDGCVATASGQSQWITGPHARAMGHRLRDALDAVVVGIGTAQADDPRLTCRAPGGRDPMRVVFDSAARLSPTAQVVGIARTSAAPTLVVCGEHAPLARRRALSDAGAEVLVIPSLPPTADAGAPRLEVQAALAALCARGVHSVLLEGGPTLVGSAFDAGCVQQVFCFVAPQVLGGQQAAHAVGGVGIAKLSEAWALARPRCRAVGADWLIQGEVQRRLGV